MELRINNHTFDFIENEIKKFCEETHGEHDVTFDEIIFAYINPGHILNDWDEGEGNDPYWNKELNKHSAIVFIEKTVQTLRSKYGEEKKEK